ncbi:hypothetical protein ASPZODRAFT_698914 [Penicilliopsis zonata CBS 506.65]|uniref:Zn(2)-C6 fungal-type domain-containing protein n=1 Tax=Penicilliopsis zonata CBS 506.65 TaxID=1073090 RepID=A0A1L9SBS9_9EURO|nr:hypothetical protein ASPZODRAFT_698914 [Penicilliopsis zonata CBS 506.65]OJJ44613.1 hypothetical protein ASPZODRAFT_698914 [Penicilliopsis zonata CBS 506.65]
MTTSIQHLLQLPEPEPSSAAADPTKSRLPADSAASEETPEAPTQETQPVSGRRRPVARGTAAYPRRRAIRACETCRSRRTRCDNKKPVCSFCEKVGAQCITNPAGYSSFDPASLVIIERLDRLEQLLQSSSPSRLQHDEPPVIQQVPPSTTEQNREPSEHASPLSNPPNGLDFGIFTIEAVMSWPVFAGRFDSRPDLQALLNRGGTMSDYQESADLLPTEDFLAKQVETGACDRLVSSFLNYVHPANPILDVPLLLQYVQYVRINGIAWDAKSCLVLLVCALGSTAEAFHAQHLSESISARNSPSFVIAKSYFTAAQKRIGSLLSHSGVLETQCFFYAGVYLMTLQQPMAAWKFFVQAAATSQGFGFPRRTPQPELVSPAARRDRVSQESLYWTCLKSELEVRMELSLPGFGLQDFSYPSAFPSPPSENLEDETARAWYYYLAEIALRRLANRILHHLFRHQEEGRFFRISQMVDSIAAFEDQATDWMVSLPPMFSLSTPESEDDVLKFVLRGHLLDCCEWMYFPFMLETINYGRRDPVLDEYTRKGLRMSVERIAKNKAGFYHRHHGAWLMLRTCTRSALILLAASHSNHVGDLVPTGWREAVMDAMDMLRFWEAEVSDARDRLGVLAELMADL